MLLEIEIDKMAHAVSHFLFSKLKNCGKKYSDF